MFIYVDCLGLPVSLAVLGFHDTQRRFQFYYLNIRNQMIAPGRHLNQSDDMCFISQPVEKNNADTAKLSKLEDPSTVALGQYTNLGKLASHKQHRSRTHAVPLTLAKAKQALHVMRIMKASESRLLVCVYVCVFIGPALGLALNYSLNWV